ncbi:hypothetical protein Aduo_005788 [Ancylostoma duodenale]
MGKSIRRNLKGTNGQQIDSPPPSPAPLSLEEVIEQLYASLRVPECIKKAFGSLVSELSSVRQERDQLREENRLLREQLTSEREHRKKARLNLTDHNSSRFPSLQVSESNSNIVVSNTSSSNVSEN